MKLQGVEVQIGQLVEEEFDIKKHEVLKLTIRFPFLLAFIAHCASRHLSNLLKVPVKVERNKRLFHLAQQPLPVICDSMRVFNRWQESKVALTHVELDLADFLIGTCHSEDA